jgi:type VI secretion system protein ImpF
MAQHEPPPALKASMLDRLIEPEFEGTIGRSGYGVEQMVDSVRRDLENLLNSHRVELEIPPEYRQVNNSVMTYGLPDLVSHQSRGPEVAKAVAAEIAEAIARFEPRLTNVTVKALEVSPGAQLKLEFQIHATLRVEPSPEVAFVTVLKLTTGETSVRQVSE